MTCRRAWSLADIVELVIDCRGDAPQGSTYQDAIEVALDGLCGEGHLTNEQAERLAPVLRDLFEVAVDTGLEPDDDDLDAERAL